MVKHLRSPELNNTSNSNAENVIKRLKKKTKTYLSCWTCRSRNIKCDLGKPHCSVCINSGLNCEGYDIKLVWDHNYKGKKDQSKEKYVVKNSRNSNRRLILSDFDKFDYMNLTNSDVDSRLNSLNVVLEGRNNSIDLKDELDFVNKLRRSQIIFKPFGAFHLQDVKKDRTRYESNQSAVKIVNNLSGAVEYQSYQMEPPDSYDYKRPLISTPLNTQDLIQGTLSLTEQHLPQVSEFPGVMSFSNVTQTISKINIPNDTQTNMELYSQSDTNSDQTRVDQTYHEPIFFSDSSSGQLTITTPLDESHVLNLQSIQMNHFFSNRILSFFIKRDLDYKLINYFLEKLSNIYIPIKFPYNPYQKIVFSLLFDNIYNIDNFYNMGLYHSIITSSAFGIYNNNKDEYYFGLGEYHKKQALSCISKSFEDVYTNLNGINDSNLEILIASIFNMVCCEVVRGENDWIVHCKGFLKLINYFYNDYNVNFRNKISSELSFMFQMFKIFIGINFVNDNFEINVLEFNQLKILDKFIKLDYFLDKLYGITNEGLDLFMKLIIIKKFIDSEVTEFQKNLNISNLSELDEYRKELTLSFELENDFYGSRKSLLFYNNTVNDLTNINDLILNYQSKNFYNAILIFYRREILREPLRAIQPLIIESLNLMEEIEKLSFFNDFKYGSIGIIWPNFIISCECINYQYQKRFEDWFKNVEKYNFRVLSKSFDVVKKVWFKREEKVLKNEDINDVCLNDVMNEMNVNFMLS